MFFTWLMVRLIVNWEEMTFDFLLTNEVNLLKFPENPDYIYYYCSI